MRRHPSFLLKLKQPYSSSLSLSPSLSPSLSLYLSLPLFLFISLSLSFSLSLSSPSLNLSLSDRSEGERAESSGVLTQKVLACTKRAHAESVGVLKAFLIQSGCVIIILICYKTLIFGWNIFIIAAPSIESDLGCTLKTSCLLGHT
jgi:hypothetical protein